MSDWTDIENPDDWEQNHWGREGLDCEKSINRRGGDLLRGYGKKVDVIKWMTNVKPPQWAIWWEKTSEDTQ